jgi:VCBS repeat-containing protein
LNFDGPINGDSGRSGEPGPLIVQAQAGRDILLPDGGWILGAEYVRQGGDLVLQGKDGQLVVIRDFFNLATPPDLHTGTGAVINGPLATKLAGPLAPGQYAQANPQASPGEPIGKVTTAEGTVEATRADGTKVRLKEGDPVYQGDVVETADDGAVGIEFADQSTFSLGDSGRMVLDEMVYDPGGGSENNSFAMSLVQGTFSFVSGQISKTDPEAMNLNTPVATIGIRGTTIAGEVGGEGNDNSISLLPDPNGSTGEIVITNDAGTVVLNVIGATVTVTSVSQAPPQPTILSPEQLASRYDNVLAINPQQPQTAPPEGQQDGEQLPQDVLDQLQDIGEQLNEAVQQGLAQARQFQLQLEGFKPFIENLLKPPQIDPLPFFNKFQNEIQVDYSVTTARLGEIISAATAAEQSASAAEVAAATKTAALVNQIIVKATASSVGMTASEAQSLASVITAPLKSLGTAATFAASASSTKESALAAMAAAAKGEAVSDELIAELEAFVGLGTGGSNSSDITRAIAKVEKIVAAAITAADKVLTKSIIAAKAAKAAGQDVAAAAKTSAADNYNTEMNSALAGVISSKGDAVSLDELSELVSGVQTQMGRIKTRVNEAGDSESFAAMKSAIGFAELTLQKADETAKAAELSMSAGLTFDQILGHATTAINAAKEAEAYRKQADAAVDLGQLGSGIDASAFDEFVRYVGFAPGQSEAEFEAGQSDDVITADEAIAAIEAATDALAAAQAYIDGTAQGDAKKTDAVFLGASNGDKGTVAVASDGSVTYTPTARSYADLANGASTTDTFYVASKNADGSFATEAVTVTVTNNAGTLGVSDLSAVETEGAKSVAASAAAAAAAAAAAVLDARGVLVEKLVGEAVAGARADVLEDASATADSEAASAQTAALQAAAVADGASAGSKGSITIAPDGSLTYTATPSKYSDLASGEAVASGLSMPHSPRMHGGKLWLLNSGTGEFGFIEPDEGRFQAVAFCPGYLRGLSFHGDFALLGLSKARGDATFSGLELEAALASRGAEPQCGLYVIDLRNGDAVHWLRIEGVVEELYDVVFLPGVRRPMAFGFKSDEIRRTLNVGAFGEL